MILGLLDINNFYVSCERCMNPALVGRAVVVLSNNDGNVVARSNEAKALGVKMGQPAHEIRPLVATGRLTALSSNYTLYGDMSARVISILHDAVPAIEVYSIDEAFLDLRGLPDPVTFAAELVSRILRWTGLPCCIGIAPTKTLAKLANFAAKQASRMDPAHSSVVDFTSAFKRDTVLDGVGVEEVWGIGSRLAARLAKLGISTAGELRDADPRRLRQYSSVVVERTVRELRGTACMALEPQSPLRKQVVCAKAFGAPVTDRATLDQALASYVTTAAVKLRQQGLVARETQVWLATNPFNPRITQYSRAATLKLATPTADTATLIRQAVRSLDLIFRPGIEYHRVGVIFTGLAGRAVVPSTLFEADSLRSSKRRDRLMIALDRINDRMGKGTVRFAREGFDDHWRTRSRSRTPYYTTRLTDLPVARAI